MNGSHDDWSAPMNMSEWAEYLLFKSFGDLAFGRNLNVKDLDENTETNDTLCEVRASGQ